jgi:uncharacterized protein (DUF433 family)
LAYDYDCDRLKIEEAIRCEMDNKKAAWANRQQKSFSSSTDV